MALTIIDTALQSIIIGAPPEPEITPEVQAWADELAAKYGAPVVGSAAEFGNPWHDEQGKFAPKGVGRKAGPPVWEAPTGPRQLLHHQANWIGGKAKIDVELADGGTGTILIDATAVGPGYQKTLGLTIDTLADTMSRNPLGPPNEVTVKIETLDAAGLGVAGWTTEDAPNVIHLQPIMAMAGQEMWRRDNIDMMPSLAETDDMGAVAFAATHEYGHLHQFATAGVDSPKVTAMYEQVTGRNDGLTNPNLNPNMLHRSATAAVGGMSKYGRVDPYEAYAEAFADWNTSGGSTTDPATLAYREAFGWA